MIVVDNLGICVDCLMFITNGEAPEGHVDKMLAEWGNDLKNIVPDCPEECDGWFSWSRCDGCGDQLGGDRHPAAFLAEEEEVNK